MKKLIITSTLIILFLSFLIFLSWAPDKSRDALKEQWAKAPSTFLEIDGVLTHIRDEGISSKETPIILIHGTSASLHTWEAWAQELKQERRVVSFDLPGFGLSDKFSDDNYSIENYVRFLHHLLKKLNIEKAIIAGNSLGGEIAWSYSLQYPALVEKLILIDSTGMPIKRENMPLAWILIEIPGVNKLMEKILPKPIVKDSVKELYGDQSKVTDELVGLYYNMTLHSGNRGSLQKRLAIAKNEDASREIEKISHPTLLIWGSLDPLIPENIGHIFNRKIEGSKLVVLEGVGHMPQEESPEVTVKNLKEFLDH